MVIEGSGQDRRRVSVFGWGEEADRADPCQESKPLPQEFHPNCQKFPGAWQVAEDRVGYAFFLVQDHSVRGSLSP
jgi:hypothetical protein